MQGISKALTFRASSIGDCLMGKYLLENVHAAYPDARLGIVVAGRAGMIRDLFASYPWLSVIEANRRDPKALLALFRDFGGSDLVVTQYAGKQGGKFSLASKIAARLLARRGGLVGFADASRFGFLYDALVPLSDGTATAEYERKALATAGVPVSIPFPKFEFLRDDSVRTRFGVAGKRYAIVHLFSGAKGRGLHPDKKRELVQALCREFPHISLLLTGGAPDRDEAISAAAGSPARVIAGEANLQETANLIHGSAAVVSVDTGVAHIAAQIGMPLVVPRSCVGRAWWLPGQYGEHAPITVLSADNLCASGHVMKEYPACLNAIPLESVIRSCPLGA